MSSTTTKIRKHKVTTKNGNHNDSDKNNNIVDTAAVANNISLPNATAVTNDIIVINGVDDDIDNIDINDEPVTVSGIDKATKDSVKYQLALKLVNKILTNIGKPAIDDLTKFIKIDREDIIKDVNKQSLDEMAPELFQHFDKTKCGYYRKTNNLVINCLRNIMKSIGYDAVYIFRVKGEVVNGRSYTRPHTFYSIK